MRDWEQGAADPDSCTRACLTEAEPDAVALAFLDVIAADPDSVARALAKSRGQPAATEEVCCRARSP